MRFDEQNMERLSDALMDEIKNMKSNGNPQLNEIIYLFQQDVLPRIVFDSIHEFFINFRKLGDIFIYKFIENLYNMKFNEALPGSAIDIYCSIEIINSALEVIQINLNTQQPMLAKRMYVVSDLTYSKVAYFLSENAMSGNLMFCSVSLDSNGNPRRSNYGPVRDNEIVEKRMILDIISGRKNSML